ncbi:Ubiquitin carboxyl-terminal hydrolase 10-B [Clonorchis sinensis]|uniref:Ubiquitin carboxyl-terminal hydrolase 10-B n=2 Tax=Clonorchis sinensis TaxID=79923 RepID=A0A8T1MGB1_CLOSI|nr:Ubiquitin carboxyl-terminal hydrolase 10-B [Clonorchis sinensis]GAA52263.1 ubiquitin carboxyl-terminal hydrolase 10 [Clonorchis sinensis]
MIELPELEDQLIQLRTESHAEFKSTPEKTPSRRRNRRKRSKGSKQSSLDRKSPAGISVGNNATASSEETIQLSNLRPRGFQNYRNCCFLNVCLQTLLHIPSVVRLFRELAAFSSDPSRSIVKSGSLCQLMLDLFKQFIPVPSSVMVNKLNAPGQSGRVELRNDGPTTVRRSDITRFDLGPPLVADEQFLRLLDLSGGFQEDGAECLTRMLSRLHEELGAVNQTGCSPTANGIEDDFSDWIITDRSGKRRPEARKTTLQGGHSRISELFSGVLIARSTVKHGRVPTPRKPTGVSVDELTRQATCVATKEPFFILPLEINDPKVTGIDSSLIRLTEVESVSDYQDVTTGLASNVNRRLGIDRLPPYLLLQLKRFSYTSGSTQLNVGNSTSSSQSGSWTIGKSLKLINVPPELIIPAKLLNHEISFTMDERRYRLRAVIFHVGETAASGHYTVAVRWEDECVATAGHSSSPLSFLYLDDTRACIVRGVESVRLLLSTHRPLDANACIFHPLSKDMAKDITKQPRTPYVVVYESVAYLLNNN